MAPDVVTYASRDPSHTVLYQVIADHLETFLASLAADPEANGLLLMCSANFTTTCSVASWPMGFFAWDVTPARKRFYWRLAASGAAFAPPVQAGAWPKRRLTWWRV